MTNPVGTPLYERMIGYWEGQADSESLALQHKVWDPTPWMLNVQTGGINEDREREILQWCHDEFGTQSWPIHDRPADWYQGSATVHGWCWFGFATEEMMKRFQEKWGGTTDEH